MNKRPLVGKKILIARARDQSTEFATHLRGLGAEVIEFPTIEIVPPSSWEPLDRAIGQLNSYEWIIFTSGNGVIFFLERLGGKGKVYRLPSSLKVCAIGPATAKGGGRELKKLLLKGNLDVITFTSSSTVNHFVELLKKEDLKKLLKDIVIASIGPVTSRTAKELGMKVHIQPKQYTVLGLTQAIEEYFGK